MRAARPVRRAPGVSARGTRRSQNDAPGRPGSLAAFRARFSTIRGAEAGRENSEGGQVSERSDAELVGAAREGRVEAFGELVHRHQRAAVAVAYSLLGDAAEAEDIAQEAFL